MRSRILKLAVVIGGVYVLLCAGLLVAMLQPPSRFGKIIAKVENPLLFMALPFRPLWYLARDGSVEPGDTAPDFHLSTVDHGSKVQLSGLRGKPVVLVFGSYT